MENAVLDYISRQSMNYLAPTYSLNIAGIVVVTTTDFIGIGLNKGLLSLYIDLVNILYSTIPVIVLLIFIVIFQFWVQTQVGYFNAIYFWFFKTSFVFDFFYLVPTRLG